MKALKQFILIGSFALSSTAAFAVENTPASPYFDVQLTLSKSGKPIYTGEVFIPQNKEVVLNTIRVLPRKVSCPPNSTVTEPSTYRDGIRIALAAGSGIGKELMISGDYAIFEPKKGEMAVFGTCMLEHVEDQFFEQTFSGRLNESESRTEEGDYSLNLKFVGSIDSPPKGKSPGIYYPR